MYLRKYLETDAAATAALFYGTVHTVNAADYTARQLDAWAPQSMDLQQWHRSFAGHHALVAVENETVIGFGDMAPGGYLDRLYVHRNHLRKGVATALCDALEAACPAGSFTTHASITARPFFLQRGYTVCRRQQVIRKGIALTNYVMQKP